MTANMENKKIGYLIVGLLGAITILLGLMYLADKSPAFGGETGLNTLCTTEFDINTGTTGRICEAWARGSIGADSSSSSTDQFVWPASAGDTIEVTYVAMKPRSPINATKIVWAATTTREGWPDYDTPREGRSPIYRFAIASTTIATGTDPLIDNYVTFLAHMAGVLASTSDMGQFTGLKSFYAFDANNSALNLWGVPPAIATSTSFTMEPGDVLNFVRQNPSTQGIGEACYGACVAATSTTNTVIDWEVRYRYRE